MVELDRSNAPPMPGPNHHKERKGSLSVRVLELALLPPVCSGVQGSGVRLLLLGYEIRSSIKVNGSKSGWPSSIDRSNTKKCTRGNNKSSWYHQVDRHATDRQQQASCRARVEGRFAWKHHGGGWYLVCTKLGFWALDFWVGRLFSHRAGIGLGSI